MGITNNLNKKSDLDFVLEKEVKKYKVPPLNFGKKASIKIISSNLPPQKTVTHGSNEYDKWTQEGSATDKSPCFKQNTLIGEQVL